jgi:uncharacterized iron-regulated membrane protein
VSQAPSRCYAAVWRWHFYAGLLCIPFVVWLACTGSIYLWKPQIEALLDRPYDGLAITGPVARPTEQVAAALAAVPGSVLHRYQLPESPGSAVRVIVGKDGEETRVYVHPQTLAVLKQIGEDDRLMQIVFRLHGELMMGKPGSWLVELAASWAIIMILTGLYLWWPRRGAGAAGLLYPRLRGGKRLFWRDLHAVTGLWVSAFALFLLISGLPWAASWGSYLKSARTLAGPVAAQEWPGGGAADPGTRAMLGEHAEHRGMTMAHPAHDYRALDRLVKTVQPLRLAGPVLIAPPTHSDEPWTAKSDAANRPLRTTLTLDGATGGILTREDFHDRQLIDRLVGYGVAAHEGQLFGLANQLLGAFTALSLIVVASAGAVLWWRRRPDGLLGAPLPAGRPRFGWAFIAGVVAMALLLPLFGLSLIAVLATERLLLRRIRSASRWLGLAAVPSS